MGNIEKHVYLNINQPNNFQLIHVMQGSIDSVSVIAHLFDGNKPYTIPDTIKSYRIMGVLPSGKYLIDGNVTKYDETSVTFQINKNMMARAGNVKFTISLSDASDDSVIETFPAEIMVTGVPGQDTEQTDEIPFLTEALEKIEGDVSETEDYYNKLIAEKGQPNGIATLDSTGKVPDSQLPQYMAKENPTGTGSFSMNRKSGTDIGAYSHAEGMDNAATQLASHAEGFQTTACQFTSHSEGRLTTASGANSHAQNNTTTASGINSHAGGLGTIAGYQSQTAIGEYNDNKEADIFEVGNGTSDARSNALELTKDGDLTIAGDYIDGTGQKISDTYATKNDSYTKDEVDNKFSALETNIDWKEAVDTYDDIATTYTNPEDGWTVNVKDTDYTYRYSGTEWVAISANAIPKATNDVDGLLTKENYAKLSSIATGAEVNQNAFGIVVVGSSTISADSKIGTLTFIAGSNVEITPDIANGTITFMSNHESISTSADTTSTASPNAGDTITAVDSVTRDSNGHVTKINTKTITLPNTPITIDSALSDTSTNPVQNKVVKKALDGKSPSKHTHNYAGSSSEGGAANSADKINTNAGSAAVPVYFSSGIPKACTTSATYTSTGTALFTRAGAYNLYVALKDKVNCYVGGGEYTTASYTLNTSYGYLMIGKGYASGGGSDLLCGEYKYYNSSTGKWEYTTILDHTFPGISISGNTMTVCGDKSSAYHVKSYILFRLK